MKALMFGISIAVVIVLGACGGGDDPGGSQADDSPSTASTATEAPETSATVAPSTTTPTTTTSIADDAPQENTTTTDATTTVAPTTTAPPVVDFDLTSLVDIVPTIDAAIDDPSLSPLELARSVVGFAFEIPPPDGSTLHDLNVGVFGGSDGALVWDVSYEVVASGGAVGDVDINLDDNGPGAVGLAADHDALMTDLGFERNGSTGSDPGDPGGPNSLNHVYSPEDRSWVLNGVAGELPNIKIWVDEDITGGSYSSEIEVLGGHRYDYSFTTPPGAGIPVPMLAALAAELPIPADATLTGGGVAVWKRGPDAFEIDKGRVTLAASLAWSLSDDGEALLAAMADSSIVDGSDVFIAAEPSFFNEGEWEPSELSESFSGGQQIGVLLLERYGGTLTLVPGGDGGFATLTLEVDLDSAVPQLLPPTG